MSRARLKCFFCDGTITKDNGWLEFYGIHQSDGRLSYPTSGLVLGIVSHLGCGPDCGYAISFDRIHAGDDWSAHLKEKTWWRPAVEQSLRTVRKFRAL
jgi:hypothetical protein